jgi:hypothetical protein
LYQRHQNGHVGRDLDRYIVVAGHDVLTFWHEGRNPSRFLVEKDDRLVVVWHVVDENGHVDVTDGHVIHDTQSLDVTGSHVGRDNGHDDMTRCDYGMTSVVDFMTGHDRDDLPGHVGRLDLVEDMPRVEDDMTRFVLDVNDFVSDAPRARSRTLYDVEIANDFSQKSLRVNDETPESCHVEPKGTNVAYMHAVMQTKSTSQSAEQKSPPSANEEPIRAEARVQHVEDDRPLDDDLYGNLAHTD